MADVVVSDQFTSWYDGLDQADTDAVYRAVELLQARGVALGFPQSSAITNSKIAMRELRVQSKGRPLRILYAFDPKRQAFVMLGADKTGDNRFYEWAVPAAERIYEEYLRTLQP